MIIYKATCLVNGKPYYGKTTKTLEHRKKKHLDEVRYNKRKKTIFHKAILKYGEENFVWEVVDTASSKEELAEKELKLIQEFNVFKKNGYNHSMVSSTSTLTKKGRKIISDKARKRCGPLAPFYGKKHPPEIMRTIADKQKKPFEIIKKQFDKMGYTLLLKEEDYLGEKRKANCICSNGHEQVIKIYTIFREDRKCLKCFHKLKKTPYQEIVKNINDLNFEVVTTEQDYYENYSKKIKVKCANGHTTEIIKGNLLRGCKCGKCRFRQFSDDELKKILKLYQEKISLDKIAEEFGCGRSVIFNRIKWELEKNG